MDLETLFRRCDHVTLHVPENDATRGLADIAAGRTFEADEAIGQLQQRRTAAAKAASPATSGKAATKKRG